MARKNKRRAPERVASWRLGLVCSVMALAAVSLLGRSLSLQVLDGGRGPEFLNSQADARSIRSETLYGERGMITDRHGEPLAVSTPVVAVWADPGEFAAADVQWQLLAETLGMSEKSLRGRMRQSEGKNFVYLARQLSPEIGRQIRSLGIRGLHLQREYRRYYPAGEATAHLLGLTDIDQIGREGLELAFETALRGEHGRKRVLRNLYGDSVRELSVGEPAKSGRDIALSIDLRLQHLAHQELKSALSRYGAKSGSVVVLDARSAEVLAMVNQPAANTNDRRRLRPERVRNRAVTDLFEPGSTVKPFTVLAALESGQYNPESIVDTSPGFVSVAGKRYSDPVNYGLLDLTGILRKSSQVGTSKLALSLPEASLYELFERLGFGRSTQSGLPGEQSGRLVRRPRPSQVERAALGFGYGMSVTALQLAQAYTAIANDGLLKPVSVVAGQEAGPARRVTSAKRAARLRHMMQSVTETGGTGWRAALPGWAVAGKTGTVHRSSAEGGYDSDRYSALFAGMAPADDPRIVAVVVIHEPGLEHYYGGEVAAPVFGRVAEAAMRLFNVAPDPSRIAAFAAAAEGRG